MIQVSSGGSVYDKAVGSDSYTNWDYSIWLKGWDEDNQNYRFSTMLEFAGSVAKLSIEGQMNLSTMRKMIKIKLHIKFYESSLKT